MRRMLIMVWGENGKQWVGRSMTLYNDPSVKWAGVAIGGIRISHVSDIKEQQSFMLTATRGKKQQHIVKPLIAEDHTQVINQFSQIQEQSERDSVWLTYSPAQQAAISAAFNQQQEG